MADEEEILPEDQATLADCTCAHEQENHDWEHCTVKDCPCEGHWEE